LPWLAVGQLVLSNLDKIIGVVKPAFTRKQVDALSSQTELLNQQISELQAAASSNADQIKQLAAQLKEVVAALELAAMNAQSDREKLRNLCLVALALSFVSIVGVIALIFVR
jgi:uncharacterized protein YukE